MRNYVISSFFFVIFILHAFLAAASNNTGQNDYVSSANDSPWYLSLRGGYVYQFATDLEKEGTFSTSRMFIQGGPVYKPDHQHSISLSVGYGYDDYDFSGYPTGLEAPWQEIHTLRFSTPIRWGFDRKWSIIAIPSLRFTAEETSAWDNGVTGGGFAGFSYRFSDQLTIGPGIGVLSQLEDSASIFPILIVNWKITDRLSLMTGKGLAATLGPGLTLNYDLTDSWDIFIGGRYEKQRFRLANDNPVPGGIGEESSFPLVAGANYSFSKKAQASLIGGMELGGELRQEDKQGRLIAKEDYDPALFLGVTFTGRF